MGREFVKSQNVVDKTWKQFNYLLRREQKWNRYNQQIPCDAKF